MNESIRCPKCGIQLPADAPAGLCPKCLVQAGFESQPLPPPGPQPTVSSSASSGFEPPSVEELAGKFPQLEILELLGKGGMGAVYKARQRGLDRLVAVKILPPQIGRDAAFAERFAREARALARLSHNHIVSVYDCGQADGLFFIVMEYVDGVNLRQTIQSGGLSPAESLAIVPQICDALQFAHDEGIVHRDIKPENILIDKRGRVKIADFGLAKLLGEGAGEHLLTATHQVMGTLRYMAPEQMQGSREVDHRADIYSLGVIFYELLTGELPMGKFAPPSQRVQVDVRLDEIVLRALEQQPEQRYQHASEVKTDLERISESPQQPRGAAAAVNVPTELDIEEARDQVRGPAIGLLITGIIQCGVTVLLFVMGALFASFTEVYRSRDGAIHVTPDSEVKVSPQPTIPRSPNWVWGPDGPALGDEWARYALNLQPQQIRLMNGILQERYREYLVLEGQQTERSTDDTGHQVTTIKAFPKPLEELEDRLWSQLDQIIPLEKQAVARKNLRIHPPKEWGVGMSLSDIIKPGLFGWGRVGARIEIWRIGNWYHWKVRTGASSNFEDAGSNPQLPLEYRRFWKEREPPESNSASKVRQSSSGD